MSGGASFDAAEALEQAFLESHERLVRHLTRRLRCPHAAEDLSQDVFLAIRDVRPIAPVRNPRAFLFRIASNLALNRLKQDARRGELRHSVADILWTAVDETTPERRLLAEEALAQLNTAITALPDRTRQILAWRRIDGLTNREIASRLGISETAVEKHMRNAMTALTAALGR